MKKIDQNDTEPKRCKSVSLKLTGEEEKDRLLILFVGNCVRDEFELLLRENYQLLRKERLKTMKENIGKPKLNNCQKNHQILKSWEELHRFIPHKMVERIHKKYPFLHSSINRKNRTFFNYSRDSSIGCNGRF